MTFSDSTFTIELNGVPTLVFQTKLQAAAERVRQQWIESHWEEVSSKGPNGTLWPPLCKLRMARTAERARYQAKLGTAELVDQVKVVQLVGLGDVVASGRPKA